MPLPFSLFRKKSHEFRPMKKKENLTKIITCLHLAPALPSNPASGSGSLSLHAGHLGFHRAVKAHPLEQLKFPV